MICLVDVGACGAETGFTGILLFAATFLDFEGEEIFLDPVLLAVKLTSDLGGINAGVVVSNFAANTLGLKGDFNLVTTTGFVGVELGLNGG